MRVNSSTVSWLADSYGFTSQPASSIILLVIGFFELEKWFQDSDVWNLWLVCDIYWFSPFFFRRLMQYFMFMRMMCVEFFVFLKCSESVENPLLISEMIPDRVNSIHWNNIWSVSWKGRLKFEWEMYVEVASLFFE